LLRSYCLQPIWKFKDSEFDQDLHSFYHPTWMIYSVLL
jgi:hypothetical protein